MLQRSLSRLIAALCAATLAAPATHAQFGPFDYREQRTYERCLDWLGCVSASLTARVWGAVHLHTSFGRVESMHVAYGTFDRPVLATVAGFTHHLPNPEYLGMCCDQYRTDGQIVIGGAWYPGEHGFMGAGDALRAFYRLLPDYITLTVYTPITGAVIPPGTTNLVPYSTARLFRINAVPEPATVAITAGGLLVLAGVAHRRRASGSAHVVG